MNILKGIGKVLLSILIVLLSIVISFALLMILIDIILLPDDYLFYEHAQVTGEILLALFLLPAIILSVFLMQKLKLTSKRQLEKNEQAIWFWNRLGLFKIPVIIIWLVAVYFCFSNINIVTENEIIVKTAFNPSGTVYEYSDVDEIETGFGTSFIACAEYKEEGSFYYKIIIDGKEIVFHQPTTNEDIERYYDQTYLELEEFDYKLVGLGISKTSSDKGYEDCDFDDDIVKRFLRIINNK